MGKVPTDLVDIFENCINRFAHFLILSFVQSKDETKCSYRIDDEINQKLTKTIFILKTLWLEFGLTLT